jgi:hypothetical protein
VWFIVSDGSVSLHLLIPQYGYLVSTNSVACSCQCSLYQFTPVPMHMLKCSWAHTQSCLFMYCYFAKIGHADIMRSIISSNCWHSLLLLSVSVCNLLLLEFTSTC